MPPQSGLQCLLILEQLQPNNFYVRRVDPDPPILGSDLPTGRYSFTTSQSIRGAS